MVVMHNRCTFKHLCQAAVPVLVKVVEGVESQHEGLHHLWVRPLLHRFVCTLQAVFPHARGKTVIDQSVIDQSVFLHARDSTGASRTEVFLHAPDHHRVCPLLDRFIHILQGTPAIVYGPGMP